MSISVVVKNSCETIGEGPHWDHNTNTLLFVDIDDGEIHRYNPVTGEHSKIKLGNTVGFAIPRTAGGYVAGLGRTLSVVKWGSDDVHTFHEVDQGTNNRFNDGKCDASGRLWAGTMGHEIAPANPERNMGSLYSLERDGRLRKHLSGIDISNGLAWAKDNRTMFYIDSVPRKVYAFNFDIQEGNLSNQRTAVDYQEGTIPMLGYPDGCCMDTDDKLWVACYGVGKVIRFDVETGKSLQTLNFPAKRTTSCCFGGPNYDELYVTCAKLGVTPEEFKNEQPLAGSIFKVTQLGVRGSPAPEYSG